MTFGTALKLAKGMNFDLEDTFFSEKYGVEVAVSFVATVVNPESLFESIGIDDDDVFDLEDIDTDILYQFIENKLSDPFMPVAGLCNKQF